jgi:hypothetical protein
MSLIIPQGTWQKIRDAWQQDWTCEHPSTELRCKTATNGVRRYHEQCLRCGDYVRPVKAAEIPPAVRDDAPAFDQELQDRWEKKKYADFGRRRDDAERAEDARWWQWYSTYLESPAWREKRRLVLARANGTCEGCAAARATQIHHLTYARAGNELLFDLVAVCQPCHQRAHPDKVLSEEGRERKRVGT